MVPAHLSGSAAVALRLQLFAFDSRDVDVTARWLRWNELTGYLTMILQKVDRASMFHGLEVRAPLLDREVIAVALRVDWRTCLDAQHGIGKLPLRRALARRVPQQSWAKHGFTVPMNDWLRGPLRPLFEDAVATRRDLVGLPLDRVALRDLYDRHLRCQADHGSLLWILLSLALWQQRHGHARWA
jgi:asparagine synthase (glutamine-hydrolysing)